MRARYAIAALVLALTTGCSWATARFDRTNTAANPFESAITAAGVGNLTPAFHTNAETPVFATPTLVVHGDNFFVGGGATAFARYRAYSVDRSGMDCTSTPNPLCGPRWVTNTTTDPAEIQEHHLFLGREVYDPDGAGCGGSPVVCDPVRTLHPTASEIPGNGAMPFSRMHFRSHFQPMGGLIEAEYLNGYDAAGVIGCDTDSCDPVWSILVTPVGHQWAAGTAVSEDRVYVRDPYGRVVGHDLGAFPVWQSTPHVPVTGAEDIVVAGDRIYAIGVLDGESSPRILGYSAAGVGCTGVPTTCAPAWRSQPLTGPVTKLAVADGRAFVGRGSDVLGFDLTGAAGCAGSPVTCGPVFAASLGDAVPSAPTLANGVLYVGTDHGVRAFDARGVSGCSGGVPRSCTPRWSALDGTAVLSPAVVAGKVFVPAADGSVHVFTLP
jgi:hypothetical protein